MQGSEWLWNSLVKGSELLSWSVIFETKEYEFLRVFMDFSLELKEERSQVRKQE